MAETLITGPLEYRRSRWKAVAFLLLSTFFLVIGIAMVADEGSASSLGVLAFGIALTAFSAWHMKLAGEVAIVVDDAGIEDRRFRMRVGWEEIERIRQRMIFINGAMQRYVNIRIKEEAWPQVSERWPHKFQRKMARFGMRTVTLQMNLLNARPKKIATAILDRARARGIPT